MLKLQFGGYSSDTRSTDQVEGYADKDIRVNSYLDCIIFQIFFLDGHLSKLDWYMLKGAMQLSIENGNT